MITRAESHASASWDHTAAILALIFNANRGPKTKAAKVEDFHPFRTVVAKPAMTHEQLHALKPLFTN